ncbi:MAG: hypothetical protein WCS43_00570 [Verrucomicrobiota bacterium]
MKKPEILENILTGANDLAGNKLQYLTGSNFFTPGSVEDGRISGSRDNGEINISKHMVETYADALESGYPIHVDTAMGGAGNERSALEALVAHLPNAGFILRGDFNGKKGKHVIWFDHPVNKLGELRDVTGDWQALKGVGLASEAIQVSVISKSLLSKPFLILTGPSGTGKTRGAVGLAKVVCGGDCHQLVAVGADWTDNRHVLGYLNPLEIDSEGRPIYETTPILDLILHANDYPDDPHVLILDEMNLSHVERYFADFLSAMELEDKNGALKLHAAGTAVTRTGVPVEGCIDFPSNLFVIGTVNIDETTYMFSPKVLDRANVIEIHAEETALENFLKKIESGVVGPEAKDYKISFLEAAHVIQTEVEHDQVPPLPEAVRLAAVDHLMALFRIMKRGRGEYGFRTGKEVIAYLRTAHFLAGPEEAGRTAWAGEKVTPDSINWQNALDEQILQKILPKLHGSRSRLSPLLGALAQYCATGNEVYAKEHFPGDDGAAPKRGLKDACATPNPVFKNSYEKLKRMIDVLVEEQFVSFIC